MEDSNIDCGFDIENFHFRFRAGGLLLHEGKILFVKTNFGDYFYVTGGGVKLGEDSKTAVIREFTEETGIKANIERLAVVCENFFRGHGGALEGKDCHILEFYYLLSTCQNINEIPSVNDENEQLVWIPVEEISDSNIKPNFIRTRINEILKMSQPLHIVEESDRNS